MKVYTAHLRPGSPPRLVREGFSIGAFLFGPLWLFAHSAWIAGIIALVVLFGILSLGGTVVGASVTVILLLGYAAMLGWNGRDLCRWSLSRQDYEESHVLAARSSDAAYARLLARDPTLAAADLL